MEIPASSDIPCCSCNSVTPTFKTSLFSRYACILLAVSSKVIRRLRLSSAETHWLSSFLDGDELCCGNGQCPLGARRGFCHYSLTLDVVPLFLPTFLHGHSSLLDAPTNAFCLPRSGPFSLFCVENIAASSRRVPQDVP